MTAWVRFCAVCLTLLLSSSGVCSAGAPQNETTSPSNRRTNEISYQDATLTEDVSWRGTVLVKGSLVVAPQTTLRIEPGTTVRFIAGDGSQQLPRLVVMGRIQAIGTNERPILFMTRQTKPVRGAWGGIHLLASEKRNQLEHCRIEGADTGIDARFSTFTAKNVTVFNAISGILLDDSTASLTATTITFSETGLKVHDSEVDIKDSSFSDNRVGMTLARSSVVMASVSVKGNVQQGIVSNDCRLKINSCEISENTIGVDIKGGEGQLFMSRFIRNHETALHLVAARLKINRCRIADNTRNGLYLEDGRAVVWGNEISGNGEHNLVYTGRETVSAVRNWWGTAEESELMAKIKIGTEVKSPRAVNVFPWLSEKPALLP